MNQAYQDPWFDPNSPNATWGRGASSVMQGLYGQMMQKQQVDEAKRQFDMTHGLAERQQGWEETNTPAHQFGQMADVTRDKFGQDVGLGDVQTNYLKQHQPKYDQTLYEKAKEMFESGGATSMQDAYNKLSKVGAYDPYQVRVQSNYGQGAKGAEALQWEDTQSMFKRGDFGDPQDPGSFQRMMEYWQGVRQKTTSNVTPRPQAREHALVVKQATTGIGGRLTAVEDQMTEIERKFAPVDDDDPGLPKRADTAKVPAGPFGMFKKDAPQWPDTWAKMHDELEREADGLRSALTFAQYIENLARSGTELPESVMSWLNMLISYPNIIKTDPSFIQKIPMLQQEMESGGQQQQGPGMGGLSSEFSLGQQGGGMWR